MKTYIIELPLFVPISQKKNLALNLNIYRNAHFFELNKAKELFHEYIGKILTNIEPMKRVMIIYTLYVGTKRRVDVSNICSIVDKFFCDTLTECKIIPDDSFDVVEEVHYKFGGFNKENPHVQALIVDLDSLNEKEEKSMRITLIQSDIEQAVINYVRDHFGNQDINPTGIEFRASRGEEGFTVELNLDETKKTLDSEIVSKVDATNLESQSSNGNTVSSEKLEDIPPVQLEESPPLKAEIAPVVTQTVPETPVVQTAPTSIEQPKSLFANLTPPVNTKSPEA